MDSDAGISIGKSSYGRVSRAGICNCRAVWTMAASVIRTEPEGSRK